MVHDIAEPTDAPLEAAELPNQSLVVEQFDLPGGDERQQLEIELGAILGAALDPHAVRSEGIERAAAHNLDIAYVKAAGFTSA